MLRITQRCLTLFVSIAISTSCSLRPAGSIEQQTAVDDRLVRATVVTNNGVSDLQVTTNINYSCAQVLADGGRSLWNRLEREAKEGIREACENSHCGSISFSTRQCLTRQLSGEISTLFDGCLSSSRVDVLQKSTNTPSQNSSGSSKDAPFPSNNQWDTNDLSNFGVPDAANLTDYPHSQSPTESDAAAQECAKEENNSSFIINRPTASFCAGSNRTGGAAGNQTSTSGGSLGNNSTGSTSTNISANAQVSASLGFGFRFSKYRETSGIDYQSAETFYLASGARQAVLSSYITAMANCVEPSNHAQYMRTMSMAMMAACQATQFSQNVGNQALIAGGRNVGPQGSHAQVQNCNQDVGELLQQAHR